jgi:hypothetical protein
MMLRNVYETFLQQFAGINSIQLQRAPEVLKAKRIDPCYWKIRTEF